MATKARGYVDSYHQSRILHIAGSTYPAAILTPYIGLYLGSLPASDGTGNTDTARSAVTWTAQMFDANTQRWYIQPTAAVTITPATAGEAVGWGVYAASSGGTPVYFDATYPFPVKANVAITIPAQELRVWAEGVS